MRVVGMRHAGTPGCSPHKPSPEPALHRAGEVHLPASMLWRRLALGSRWAAVQQRSCAAAEIQQHHLKFSRKQQSARQGESAACQPTWLSKGPGTVAGLLGSHLIGAVCPRAPRGAPCPCREGCSDRGTLTGSRPAAPQRFPAGGAPEGRSRGLNAASQSFQRARVTSNNQLMMSKAAHDHRSTLISY